MISVFRRWSTVRERLGAAGDVLLVPEGDRRAEVGAVLEVVLFRSRRSSGSVTSAKLRRSISTLSDLRNMTGAGSASGRR